MIRRDLGDNIMEISHTNGTDRWLVIKKQLDASNVRHVIRRRVVCLFVFVYEIFFCFAISIVPNLSIFMLF